VWARHGERPARLGAAPGRDVEDVHAAVVRGSPTDYDNLATNKSRRVSATWWWKVALHLEMYPVYRLYDDK
jgi:hypothetical protein